MSVAQNADPPDRGTPGATVGTIANPAKSNAKGDATPFATLAFSLVQIAAGVFTNCHSLLADGLYSLATCATDLNSVSRTIDSANLEAVGAIRRQRNTTAILASSLAVGLSLGVFINGVIRLQTGYGLYRVKSAAVVLAILCFAAKNWMARREADMRVDLESGTGGSSERGRVGKWLSVIVLVSVVGSLAGLGVMDPLGSITISWILLDLGWRTGKTAIFGVRVA